MLTTLIPEDSDRAGERFAASGHAREERDGGRVEIDAYRIHRILDDGVGCAGGPGLISTATRIYKAAGKNIAAGVNRSFPELAWLRPRKADGILKAPMGQCPR
jgi:hypothetical protein